MPRGTNVDRVAAAVLLLTKAPRTANEIGRLLGIPAPAWLRNWLKAFEAEGLIEKDGKRRENGSRKPSIVWKWIA